MSESPADRPPLRALSHDSPFSTSAPFSIRVHAVESYECDHLDRHIDDEGRRMCGVDPAGDGAHPRAQTAEAHRYPVVQRTAGCRIDGGDVCVERESHPVSSERRRPWERRKNGDGLVDLGHDRERTVQMSKTATVNVITDHAKICRRCMVRKVRARCSKPQGLAGSRGAIDRP